MISSCLRAAVTTAPVSVSFNLVIEVLLISSASVFLKRPVCRMFQSRNRGSFDFKGAVLLLKVGDKLFQSRNRGSFDFKLEC